MNKVYDSVLSVDNYTWYNHDW